MQMKNSTNLNISSANYKQVVSLSLKIENSNTVIYNQVMIHTLLSGFQLNVVKPKQNINYLHSTNLKL